MNDLKNSLTGKRVKRRPDPSHLAFAASMLIVAFGLILFSMAFGVQIAPEIAPLIHP